MGAEEDLAPVLDQILGVARVKKAGGERASFLLFNNEQLMYVFPSHASFSFFSRGGAAKETGGVAPMDVEDEKGIVCWAPR